MKKAIIIIVVVAMFGYAIYEFIDSDDTTMDDNNSDRITATGPGPDDNENSNNNNVDNDDDESNENTENSEPTVGLDKGDFAPDFELELLETGEKVKLSDYQGEKVMLNFWATWCGPCRAEMPDMQKLHENEDVVILAVNLTASAKNEMENIPEFIDEFGLTFNVLLDESNEVATLYEIKPIPTSYLIDEDGVIQNMALGALNYDMMIQGFEMME